MDKNKFCPIVKDACKGDLCLAWDEGICSFFNFFASFNNLNCLNTENTYISREQILKDEAKAEQLLPETPRIEKRNGYSRITKMADNKSNIGLAWSSDEDDALLKEFDSGKSSHELSKIHKRTLHAIELRLEKFGKIQLSK